MAGMLARKRCGSLGGFQWHVSAENMCARCGGEAEQCCMDSEQVEYCAGSNMRCDTGVVSAPMLYGARLVTHNTGATSC